MSKQAGDITPASDFIYPSLQRIAQERDAWQEAFLALRAYSSNNNGENSVRKRAAIDRLKELGLLK